MTVFKIFYKWFSKRTPYTVLTLLGLWVVASLASADEFPSFRQGLWEFHRTTGEQKIETKECTDPSENMKQMNAMLQKAGCTFSPVKKSGKTYTFTSECSMKNPSGGVLNAHSTSVITVESDSAYTVDVDVVTNGQPSRERLVARRIGDCPK